MNFSQIIRFHRERLKYNKKELAARVGVTQPYIVQIENDGRVPGDGVVLRLADVLELERRELLFSAYRARASDDTRHFFTSIFDDLTPNGEFSQPFIESRKDLFESPEFSLRHLATGRDGAYQVALLIGKNRDAIFSGHAHSVPQIFVLVDGSFELDVAGTRTVLSRDAEISTKIGANQVHSIRVIEPGRLLSVTLGEVMRRLTKRES